MTEKPHDKTNKVSVCPAKTQTSLGIHPVWSESLLSAWRKLGSLATHWAHSEDSDQTGRMPGWSESLMGAYSIYWFCHVAAQLCFCWKDWCSPEKNNMTTRKQNLARLTCDLSEARNPQRWDDEPFRALKISSLNHSAMGAAGVTSLSCPPGQLAPRGASCPGLSYPTPWLSSPPGGKLSRLVYLAPPSYRGNNLIWCFQFICNILWYLHVFLKL